MNVNRTCLREGTLSADPSIVAVEHVLKEMGKETLARIEAPEESSKAPVLESAVGRLT